MNKKHAASKGKRSTSNRRISIDLVSKTWSGKLRVPVSNNGGSFSLNWLGKSYYIRRLNVGRVSGSQTRFLAVLDLSSLATDRKTYVSTEELQVQDLCCTGPKDGAGKLSILHLRSVTLPAIRTDSI